VTLIVDLAASKYRRRLYSTHMTGNVFIKFKILRLLFQLQAPSVGQTDGRTDVNTSPWVGRIIKVRWKGNPTPVTVPFITHLHTRMLICPRKERDHADNKQLIKGK